jgi:hypothetical protein
MLISIAGDTPWNINTSQNGDKLTAGPSDPGLINFPGLNPPAVAEVNNNQNGALSMSTLGRWGVVTMVGLGMILLLA